MTKVSVIIPAWNLWDITQQCLKSLADTSPSDALEVIVVDNGSTDATVEQLAPTLTHLFGDAGCVLRMPTNKGFAKACNAGAAVAKHSLLFFLNNDTILTENWLPPLIHTLLTEPKVGMVGSLLLYPNNTVQHCGVCFSPSLQVEHLYATFPAKHPLVHKRRFLQAITGAALLIRANVFQQCGAFHEEYVNGFEDIDLSCAVRKQGLRLMCEPKSRIYHLESQTPGRFTHDKKNSALLNTRWMGSVVPDLHTIVVRDGLVPHFDARLDMYITLPEAKEQALTQAFSQSFHLERCCTRLESEPLWQGGYALLAHYYEQQGQWDKALAARWKLVEYVPLPKHVLALQKTATRMQHTDSIKKAQYFLNTFAQDVKNKQALHKRAQEWLQYAQNSGDTVRVTLCQQWLDSVVE